MVKTAVISRNLLIVALFALLLCCDIRFWHNIPLGYEGMLAYGAFSLWFGLALTVVALGLIVFALIRHGAARSRFIILGCGALILISFVIAVIIDPPNC